MKIRDTLLDIIGARSLRNDRDSDGRIKAGQIPPEVDEKIHALDERQGMLEDRVDRLQATVDVLAGNEAQGCNSPAEAQ